MKISKDRRLIKDSQYSKHVLIFSLRIYIIEKQNRIAIEQDPHINYCR